MANLTFIRIVEFLVAGVLALAVIAVPLAIFHTTTELTKLQLENKPVVENMRIVEARKSPDREHIFVRVVGDKARGREECGPPVSITGSYGTSKFESIIFMDDMKRGEIGLPDANEEGKNVDFGWWKLKPEPTSPILVFHVFHKCDTGLVQTTWTMSLPGNFL